MTATALKFFVLLPTALAFGALIFALVLRSKREQREARARRAEQQSDNDR